MIFNKSDVIRDFYQKIFKINEPYDFQKLVWEKVFSNSFPLLLSAPTGSGKTEAVVAPFLFQFINYNFCIAPRLIYVLPMRVLANSIANRIEVYARRVSTNISVKVQHGDIPNAPFFISDIVVTTLDQFLYGFARASVQLGRHIDVPAGSIASSLVVFDEAHMYRDEFTFSIMRALMEILYKSNIPFILMTATMPESLKNSLFESMTLDENRYIKFFSEVNSSVRITLFDKPLYENNEINITDDILRKISHKKTLIVVNQVKRAQKIYDEIKSRLSLSDENIVLLHSRFTRADRENHENKALSLIPHKIEGKIVRPEKLGVVIATQVLEAGIDFSAELLLTELAPADSLVQRAGRCARYEGEKGEMIIFPLEDKENKHLPYKKEHLDETIKWLQDNPDFNIRDFSQVCSFVDETLDYQANDYEARDTLIDLYECVLYADTEPSNIQLRKSKPAKLVVLDIPEGSSERAKSDILKIIKSTDISAQTITVDTSILWALFKNRDINIQWEVQWRYDEKEKEVMADVVNILKNREQREEEDPRIGPFKTYILNGKNYKRDKGIEPDICEII